MNPIVDNLPVADTVIHGQSIPNFVAEHPRPGLRPGPPAVADAVGQGSGGRRCGRRKTRRPANIAAANKAFGTKGLLQLSKYKTQLTTLVVPLGPAGLRRVPMRRRLEDLPEGCGRKHRTSGSTGSTSIWLGWLSSFL